MYKIFIVKYVSISCDCAYPNFSYSVASFCLIFLMIYTVYNFNNIKTFQSIHFKIKSASKQILTVNCIIKYFTGTEIFNIIRL